MTPPIHVSLAQHPINTGRGRGLSQVLGIPLLVAACYDNSGVSGVVT